MKKQIPHGDENLICPTHHKPMSEVCHKCPWWTHVRGMNPNTGEEVDDWQCAIGWLPLLLIQAAKESREGAAATESFRNEIVARADAARRRPEVIPVYPNPLPLIEQAG